MQGARTLSVTLSGGALLANWKISFHWWCNKHWSTMQLAIATNCWGSQPWSVIGCSCDELWRLWRLIHMYDRQHIDNQFQTKMALCDAIIWALFAWHYHVFTSPMIYHDMNNHTFSAFRLWSSIVSVLISVTTDMSPTEDLIVTFAQVPSPVAPKLHFFGCSSPFWGNARKRYFHSVFNVSRLWHVSCRERLR